MVISKLLRDGTYTEDPRLDRLVQFDERSRAFPVRTTITATAPRSYTWRVDQWFDQGNEGACVGFAWTHELAARPKVITGLTDRFAREEIYWAAQAIDPWAGGAYPGASPFYEGTSVLAGAKICQKLGYISEYRWAFGLDDLRMAIGYKGPAVLGINWYEGMFGPDSKGYLRPTGRLMGGHAIVAFANSERYDRIRVWNSWGRDWGNGGTAFISFEDLEKLLHEDGEACIPVVRTFG